MKTKLQKKFLTWQTVEKICAYNLRLNHKQDVFTCAKSVFQGDIIFLLGQPTPYFECMLSFIRCILLLYYLITNII